MFFIAANENQACIRETFGVPTIASTYKLYCCTVPCFQDTKAVTITNDHLKFTVPDISLQDGSYVSVVCQASYSIDTSFSKNILQAYKSFLPKNTHMKKSDHNSSSDWNIDDGIKCTIREVVMKYMKPLHNENIDAIDLKFTDSIFEEVKRQLRSKKVILKQFQIQDVLCDAVTSQVIKEHVGSKKSSINEAKKEDQMKILVEEDEIQMTEQHSLENENLSFLDDDVDLNYNFDSPVKVYEEILDNLSSEEYDEESEGSSSNKMESTGVDVVGEYRSVSSFELEDQSKDPLEDTCIKDKEVDSDEEVCRANTPDLLVDIQHSTTKHISVDETYPSAILGKEEVNVAETFTSTDSTNSMESLRNPQDSIRDPIAEPSESDTVVDEFENTTEESDSGHISSAIIHNDQVDLLSTVDNAEAGSFRTVCETDFQSFIPHIDISSDVDEVMETIEPTDMNATFSRSKVALQTADSTDEADITTNVEGGLDGGFALMVCARALDTYCKISSYL